MEDIKQFSLEITEKLNDKWRGREIYLSDLSQSIRDMIAHKMKKEGWVKTGKPLEINDEWEGF